MRAIPLRNRLMPRTRARVGAHVHALALPLALLLAFAASLAYARDAKPGALAIAAGWARPTPPGADVAAAYFEIRNAGASADRLLAVTTPVAARAELHRTVVEDGMAGMRPVDALPVPARGRVVLAPGGVHLMLFGLRAPLVAGQRVRLLLRFEKAGSVEAEIVVATAAGADDAAHVHP